jgi:radical SAM protein with 4Fe4S-binding SPASM domain
LPEKKPILELELKKILDSFERKGFSSLEISGGEPFLFSEILLKTIKYCNSKGLKLKSISTNGSIYEEKCVKVLRSIKDFILHVSLDAATSITYQKMRNSHQFKQVVRNIQRFIDRGLNVFIGMTVTNKNYQEIAPLIKLAEEIGAKGVSIGGFIPIGKGKQVSPWILTQEEIEQILIKLKTTETKIQILGPGDNICRAGTYEWCILPNGDLYPCPLFLNFEEAKIDNICSKGHSISNTKWLRWLTSLKPPIKCQSCDAPPLCYGGCKAVFYEKFKKFPEVIQPPLLCS